MIFLYFQILLKIVKMRCFIGSVVNGLLSGNQNFRWCINEMRKIIKKFKKIGGKIINSFLDLLIKIVHGEIDIDIYIDNFLKEVYVDLEKHEFIIVDGDNLADYMYIVHEIVYYEGKMSLDDNLQMMDIKNNDEDFEFAIAYLVILKIFSFVPECPELVEL